MIPLPFLTVAAALLVAALLWLWHALSKRNVLLWLPAYAKRDWAGGRESRPTDSQIHVMWCIADHFEPGWQNPGLDVERQRVQHWLRSYPELADRFQDADGLPPRHTFFFPAEQYKPEHLERLAELVAAGYGEVEIHLHHSRDTSEGLRRKLLEFVETLRRHGLLGSHAKTGLPRFAFVHGDWSLDNSGPNGRWCGVNDELRVLGECGCYADFTLPSAPSPTQTRRINSIYYATDDPARPKSHDDGVEVRVGGKETGDLMIVQGPLGMTWPGGRFALLPRLENGNIAAGAPPTAVRAKSWINTRVCVAGRPDWVFVKLHTHGCKEENWGTLFGSPMTDLHKLLSRRYNDGVQYRLHYVTAREMYNVIKAAQHGLTGQPGPYRDYEIISPPVSRPDERECRPLQRTETVIE